MANRSPTIIYRGIITSLNTTPPSVTILPYNTHNHHLPQRLRSRHLTQQQLEHFLFSLSLGAAEVSFTVVRGHDRFFAEIVQITGYVDDERWKGQRESEDIFGGEGLGYGYNGRRYNRTIEGSGNRARRFDDWGRPRVRRSEILPSQPEVLPSTEWD